MATSRVLLADDHPLFLWALTRVLTSSTGFEVVAATRDGREAIAAAQDQRPDLAILDVEMPDVGGSDVLSAIRAFGLRTRVLLLSEDLDATDLPGLARARPDGLLGKDVTPENLLAALSTIANDGSVWPATLESTSSADERDTSLSRRELDVLRLLADGLTAPTIAARLGIAPSSVKSHLHRLYRRLDVSDRAAAVAAAMRRGLIR